MPTTDPYEQVLEQTARSIVGLERRFHEIMADLPEERRKAWTDKLEVYRQTEVAEPEA